MLFLHDFYFRFFKLLFKVVLVLIGKYGQVSEGSKSVALRFGFYGAQVRVHMHFYAQNQKCSRVYHQLVVNFEPCRQFKRSSGTYDPLWPISRFDSVLHFYKAGDQASSVELLDDLRFILSRFKKSKRRTSRFTDWYELKRKKKEKSVSLDCKAEGYPHLQ